MRVTEAERERVAQVVRDNAASLLRLARAHSLCEDDAADAYQRTLEIYLRRLDRVDHATAGAWLRTVCKHEAMRLRASRQRILASEDMAWDERPSPDAGEAHERAESLERVAHAAEALQACRPEEAQAMLLRADGSSYKEIGELCGWSYAKVNRCLAGGRARFLARFASIESGAACAGYLPVLSAIVDGEATPEDYLSVRPHLRHCASCRSTLKALYDSEPALKALAPPGALLALAPDGPGLIARALESLSAQVGERMVRAQSLVEAAAASKAAAVVASTAAVAGGAAAVDHASRAQAHERPRAAAPARVERAPVPRPHRPQAKPASVAPTAVRPVPTATAAARPAPTPAMRSTAAPTRTPPATAAPEFSIEAAPPPAPPSAAPPPAPASARKAAATDDLGFER